jgi:deazaflavin-dependent oxidoreductase (nitroreductase family)
MLYTQTRGGLLSLGSRAYPTLLLTTTGHKTARPHTVPLFYLEQNTGLLVVASNFGRPDHPGWSTNLLHNPAGNVQVAQRTWTVKARLLPPDEKAKVWPSLIQLFDGWQGYEDETTRSIRVFSLDPF